jgi:antitoxin (DNA-binding transcriptional repressor) of toxin-antitoxin stability system
MIAVGVRELKNRLSEFLRLVRAGEVVLVTDRGEVVAELRQPGGNGERTDLPAGLVELARRGLATLPEPRPEGGRRYPRLPEIAEDGTAQRLLDEDRGTP